MASHTAPQVSFEEEVRELVGMNEREWSVFIKDKYGRIPGDDDDEEEGEIEEEDDIYEELLDDFFEELAKIPTHSKTEYIEALIQVPEIVEHESNPILFLRFKNYEPKDAALALCEYWKTRVEIFQDNAFKPMTVQGALSDMVSTVLQLQTLVRILPNDDNGRTVFCFDRTDIRYSNFDPMQIVKYFWFVCHKALLDSESAQKEGVVFIAVNRQVGMDFMKRKSLSLLLRNCIPIKPCCFHVCCSSVTLRLVVPAMKFIMNTHTRQRTELHPSLQTPAVINELKPFGLRRENLPLSIGGTYKTKNTWVYECERIVANKNNERHRSKRSVDIQL